MSECRKNNSQLVDLQREEDIDKPTMPRYHVDKLRKNLGIYSRLFTVSEQADMVVKDMRTADMLDEIHKHNKTFSPALFGGVKPELYCDEASWKKLCPKKQPFKIKSKK